MPPPHAACLLGLSRCRASAAVSDTARGIRRSTRSGRTGSTDRLVDGQRFQRGPRARACRGGLTTTKAVPGSRFPAPAGRVRGGVNRRWNRKSCDLYVVVRGRAGALGRSTAFVDTFESFMHASGAGLLCRTTKDSWHSTDHSRLQPTSAASTARGRRQEPTSWPPRGCRT